MKVQDLTGALLDYWVARADGYQHDISKLKDGGKWCAIETRDANVAPPCSCVDKSESVCAIETVPNAIKPFHACILGNKVGRGKHPWRQSWFYPSTLWNHAGPIIERERGSLNPEMQEGREIIWVARMGEGMSRYQAFGPTPLIAACRAYVASKFGPEVPDVPDVEG